MSGVTTPTAPAAPAVSSAAAALPPAGMGATRLLLIGAALLLPLLFYFSTAASIVAIWQRSDTFAHGYVILPISFWLIWQRRAELRLLPVAPYYPALAPLALCGLAWLLGELGDVGIVRQYAFALMLPLSALALLGRSMAGAMAFPLLFILFGVPFGEVFIEPLIGVTANFTVDALQATGIPVFREGNSFTIPTGSWSVVEACSGVRYLISSVTLGSLYAYLTYRATWRRALFVLLSILVPILANGLRAYMIVMMGHLSGMTMAVGFDHLIYGWVFFGIVMFLLFWIGSYWRDDQVAVAPAAAAPAAMPAVPLARVGAAALAIAACLAAWPLYLAYIDHAGTRAAPVTLDSFQSGWQAQTPFSVWKPAFPAAAAELHQSYAQGGEKVALSLFYYRQPPDGTKLISSSNRVAGSEAKAWIDIGSQASLVELDGRTLQVRESRFNGPEGKLLVWQWFWIDGASTASAYTGKLLQVRQKLVHRSDDGAALMLAAPYDEQPEQARRALRAFLGANLGALERTLAANRKP